MGEIATSVANADPAHEKRRDTRAACAEMLGTIPSTRLRTPDEYGWCEAGLVPGILARTQGLPRDQQTEVLNDALILLSAARSGPTVLTNDRDHDDLLQQLCPEARFVLY